MDTLGNDTYSIETDPTIEIVKVIAETTMRRFQIPSAITRDDMLQQGYLLYFQSKQNYKDMGYTFKTYAWQSIRFGLYDFILENASLIKTTKNTRRKSKQVSYFSDNVAEDKPLEDFLGFDEDLSQMYVDEFLAVLSDEELMMLKMRYAGWTWKDIGAYYGVSKQRVNVKYKSVIQKWGEYNAGHSGNNNLAGNGAADKGIC